jgi:hypothetical protein
VNGYKEENNFHELGISKQNQKPYFRVFVQALNSQVADIIQASRLLKAERLKTKMLKFFFLLSFRSFRIVLLSQQE